jgi:hypothetical protein
MKKLGIFTFIIIALGLTACDSDLSVPRAIKDTLKIKVLKSLDEDTDAPKDFSILCIDNVKYLMTPQGGITVKFQANEAGDPSAEECE